MAILIKVNFWIFGDVPTHIPTLKIESSETMNTLQNEIKERYKATFSDVEAYYLELWKVDIDARTFDFGLIDEEYLENQYSLHPLDRIDEQLSDIPSNHLHIIVRRPPKLLAPQGAPSDSPNDILQKRKYWMKRASNGSPSDNARPKTFASVQKDKTFYFDRPPETAATIPVTLYNAIFGQFQDDCKTYEPTEADHKFVWAFSYSMSQFHESETLRAQQALADLREYDLPFIPGKIGEFTTDGDLRCKGECYAVIEFKSEIHSSNSEPLFQAAWYYATFARLGNMILKNTDFVLPCFLLYVAGAHVGFAAAVFTDRPHIQVLSPMVPLFYHATDVDIEMTAARCFCAAKKAIQALRGWYREMSVVHATRVQPRVRSQVQFPYKKQFNSLFDGTVVNFLF